VWGGVGLWGGGVGAGGGEVLLSYGYRLEI
jgi:hypothetical protein